MSVHVHMLSTIDCDSDDLNLASGLCIVDKQLQRLMFVRPRGQSAGGRLSLKTKRRSVEYITFSIF